MNTLEQRVASLERSVNLYRIGFISILAVAIGLSLMSFNNRKTNAPDVIQAKAFQVVNDDGKVLGEFNSEDRGGQLSTFDENGTRLISLFRSEEGTGGMNTFNDKGNVIFKLTNTEGGGGYLSLLNGQKAEVLQLGTSEADAGYLRLNDSKGDKLAWLTYTKDGGGYFSLSNAGKETIRMSTPLSGGRLSISNSDGNRVGYMGTQENKDGNITTWNAQQTITGSLPERKQ